MPFLPAPPPPQKKKWLVVFQYRSAELYIFSLDGEEELKERDVKFLSSSIDLCIEIQ